MKRILFALVVFSSACKVSTESKLEAAIKNQYRKEFDQTGAKEESLSVDNVTFFISDSSHYYRELEIFEMQMANSMGELVNEGMLIKGDTDILKYGREQDTFRCKANILDSLAQNTPKGDYVYFVKYHIKYRTNKEANDGIDSMFLHYPDLERVYLNIDSL